MKIHYLERKTFDFTQQIPEKAKNADCRRIYKTSCCILFLYSHTPNYRKLPQMNHLIKNEVKAKSNLPVLNVLDF